MLSRKKCDEIINKIEHSYITKEWVIKNIKLGRIPLTVPIFEDMCRLNEYLYPDNWDINVSLYIDILGKEIILTLFFVIHFDEIKVVNKDGNTTIINDVFFKFSPNAHSSNGVNIDNARFAKSTFTPAQHSSGYSWSHTPRIDPSMPIEYQSICTGTSNLVDSIIMLSDNWKKSLYSLFLISIKTYIEYESLEGGPHIKMSAINNKNFKNIYQPSIDDVNIVLEMLHLLPSELIDIKFEGNDYYVNINNIENWFRDKLPPKYFVNITENGRIYNPIIIDNYIPMTTDTDIWWKGQNIKLKIIPDKTTNLDSRILHPFISEMITEYIRSTLIFNDYVVKKQETISMV
jgi:hypothetical protein